MAYGNFLFASLKRTSIGGGVQTEFGTLIPPGVRVSYVRSTGVQSGDDGDVAQRLLPTLAQGLAQCRSGMGDIVFVLPGHSESVSDATMLTNLVAGTRIIGVGDPNRSDAPTFRWTATTSQWAVNKNDVEIANLRLKLEGANGVVKAINITGSGCRLNCNNILVASGATAKATIAIEVGSGATECEIAGNYIRGTATHNVTDCIKLVGATTPDDCVIKGNLIVASATAANGLIHATVAAKRVSILNNVIYNTHTSSTACIAFDDVAVDGVCAFNMVGTMNDGTASAQGITFGTSATVKAFENYSCDEPKKSGVLAPAVVAT